jgi:hypothetical protein
MQVAAVAVVAALLVDSVDLVVVDKVQPDQPHLIQEPQPILEVVVAVVGTMVVVEVVPDHQV